MIFSTHRLTSVVEMDEIIVISGGKAIERGSHAEAARRQRRLSQALGRPGPHAARAADQADDDNDDDDDEDED